MKSDREKMDSLMKEALDAVNVVRDIALGRDKQTAEEVAQMLLAHATSIIEMAKTVATPYKIELHYHGCTLRYPEDCEAGYQLSEAHIEELRSEQKQMPWLKSYADSLQQKREAGIPPKFLGDNIWDSSENCSDQGLSIFNMYDDFSYNRGDYNWRSPTKDNEDK